MWSPMFISVTFTIMFRTVMDEATFATTIPREASRILAEPFAAWSSTYLVEELSVQHIVTTSAQRQWKMYLINLAKKDDSSFRTRFKGAKPATNIPMY